jgi:hypothetical protein
LTEQRNHLAYWLDLQTDALGVGLNHECLVLLTTRPFELRTNRESKTFTGSQCHRLLASLPDMPIRYREVLEHMKGYLAAYPLGFQADETGQRNIVADRNGYRLGESVDLQVIEEMVKGENEAFTNNMQRKTFRQLIAMFAS